MIGARRHRVVIERLITPSERNAFGETVKTYEPIGYRWASVEPLEGAEFFDAQQIQSRVDHRIRLPYDSITATITPAMRVKHGARVFDVQSVINPGGRNAGLEVIARERA